MRAVLPQQLAGDCTPLLLETARIPVGTAWRWMLLALACLVPAVPLLFTLLPPLADYPNHLARMQALGHLGDDPALGQMLAPAWSVLPNLGADAVMPWLMRVTSPYDAGRLLLLLEIALPVLGCAALSWATFGVVSPWALGASLVTCNALFLLGFLNFTLAIGLAMPAAALWFRFRETRPVTAIAGAAAAACVLFFCHLLGVLFFAILIAACEAERCWAVRDRVAREAGVRFMGLAAVLAGPAALYASTALHGAGGPMIWAGWQVKAGLAIYPVLNYVLALDVVTALVIIVLLGLGLATGRLDVPVRWRLVIGGLAVAFVVSPVIGKGLAYVDSRFAVLLGFALFAGVRPVRVPLAPGLAVGIVLAGLLGVRTAVVATLWSDYDSRVADVRAAILPIPAGARVLPVWGARATAPSARALADGTMMDWHLPALVMIDRSAFWPYLFADPGQQPIRWRDGYAELAAQTQQQVLWPYLSWRSPSADQEALFPLWREWDERYDYVLLMAPDTGMDVRAVGDGRLHLMRQTPSAVLYRVCPRNGTPNVGTPGSCSG